ncbi:hypothetical protein SteCoe_17136 [Stentor coeruleus]|uniref:C2H2-type domain-containing protein n=1 Tax=Stentor coeruleus TaxID=5963 RepID=A0A1R2BZM0_9CILI|nr:hypothetical protein SteCoe_17136 [Stentor coeruleus]
MNGTWLKCYYKECEKQYQSQSNLVRHINTYHLDYEVFFCTSCKLYFTSAQDILNHRLEHSNLSRRYIPKHRFLLSDHYIDEKSKPTPTSILKIPVLPSIEEDRKCLSKKCKLPLNPEILSALVTSKKPLRLIS